jgi:hypothetical protein
MPKLGPGKILNLDLTPDGINRKINPIGHAGQAKGGVLQRFQQSLTGLQGVT